MYEIADYWSSTRITTTNYGMVVPRYHTSVKRQLTLMMANTPAWG
jgi:hypothetical protein